MLLYSHLLIAQVYEEEVLTLNKISRSDMGAYLCIASNGIPPSVSKRITIKVHCKYNLKTFTNTDGRTYIEVRHESSTQRDAANTKNYPSEVCLFLIV